MAYEGKPKASARYSNLEASRDSFLRRARDAAELTIPTLLPPDGHSGSTNYKTPFQAVGARGVNHLASKLLMALMPPNSPFFRLQIDDFDLETLGVKKRGQAETALARIERAVMTEIESKAIRVPVFEALKQLIVAGNALVQMPKDGGLKVFRLDRYVVKRDTMGNIMEIVVKESISPQMLGPEIIELIKQSEEEFLEEDHKNLDLFTHVTRQGKQFYVCQEVKGIKLPNTEGTYPLDKLPFIPLRYTAIDGEDYGRGFIEEYIGDLKSLEALTQAVVEGSAAAAKVLFLVRPNGSTKMRQIAESPNGAIIQGDQNDVGVLQVGKQADLRVAQDTARQITERLAYAFLLNSSVQRQAERVTAEEVRYMAQELETALGGVYSVLSQEFQLPIITLLLARLQKGGKMPRFPKDTIKPQITTGLEALGRGQDLNKLATLLKYLQPLGPEAMAKYLNIEDYINRLGSSLGIDTSGLIIGEEERQAMMAKQQQMAQQAMAQKSMMSMGEKAAPAVAKGVMENMPAMMQQAAQGQQNNQG